MATFANTEESRREPGMNDEALPPRNLSPLLSVEAS